MPGSDFGQEQEGESFKSCKEGEILGSSSVDRGLSRFAIALSFPLPPECAEAHFRPALGARDPGCLAEGSWQVV